MASRFVCPDSDSDDAAPMAGGLVEPPEAGRFVVPDDEEDGDVPDARHLPPDVPGPPRRRRRRKRQPVVQRRFWAWLMQTPVVSLARAFRRAADAGVPPRDDGPTVVVGLALVSWALRPRDDVAALAEHVALVGGIPPTTVGFLSYELVRLFRLVAPVAVGTENVGLRGAQALRDALAPEVLQNAGCTVEELSRHGFGALRSLKQNT